MNGSVLVVANAKLKAMKNKSPSGASRGWGWDVLVSSILVAPHALVCLIWLNFAKKCENVQ